MGHRWGGSPSQGGGWQVHRERLPLPILLGCSTKALPGAWPWSGWPWKPFSRAASQKARNPTPSLGPTSELLGLLGGSSGREAPRPARSPRLPS